MTPRSYATPEAFRIALDQRLKSSTPENMPMARHRQLLVFERFLARVVQTTGEHVILKGGLVLELRLRLARTTKDVDLRIDGSAATILARLQEAGRLVLGDHMQFEIVPDRDHPAIKNDGMKYDGLRFNAACKLGARRYGDPFGVDVAFGDPLTGEIEEIVADDTLGFAGIAPPRLRVYPIETHIAEKLHAYTMPRSRPNSRVKDLPDIALLATTRLLSAETVRQAIETTFAFRGTHPVPATLPPAPAHWTEPYAALAGADSLPWERLTELESAVRTFIDPILAGRDGTWDPTSRAWTHDDHDERR
jgi:hypothetical protein